MPLSKKKAVVKIDVSEMRPKSTLAERLTLSKAEKSIEKRVRDAQYKNAVDKKLKSNKDTDPRTQLEKDREFIAREEVMAIEARKLKQAEANVKDLIESENEWRQKFFDLLYEQAEREIPKPESDEREKALLEAERAQNNAYEEGAYNDDPKAKVAMLRPNGSPTMIKRKYVEKRLREGYSLA